MLLTMLNIGETGKIKRIGGNEETRRFLNNLGFVVGTEVSVVQAADQAFTVGQHVKVVGSGENVRVSP